MATHELENRSSFEPFKNDSRNISNGLLTPSSLTKTSSVTTSKSGIMSVLGSGNHSEENKQNAKEPIDTFQSTSRYCRPHSPPGKFHIPATPTHLPQDHHRECTHCKPLTGRVDSFTTIRPPIPPTLCQCPMCVRIQDQKCTYPQPSRIPYHANYKYLPPVVSNCRDPNCMNCAKVNNKNVQNFLHPALVHQCTHSSLHKPSYTPPPLPVNQNGAEGHQSKLKPYVCNWVANGKHCGNSYVNSDDLFQHLRTHTSLQQQQQSEIDNRATAVTVPHSGATPTQTLPHNVGGSTQNTCRIHGCPCRLPSKKTSPRTSIPGYSYGQFESSSFRYSPYARPLPHVAGTSYTGHNYVPPHGFHY